MLNKLVRVLAALAMMAVAGCGSGGGTTINTVPSPSDSSVSLTETIHNPDGSTQAFSHAIPSSNGDLQEIQRIADAVIGDVTPTVGSASGTLYAKTADGKVLNKNFVATNSQYDVRQAVDNEIIMNLSNFDHTGRFTDVTIDITVVSQATQRLYFGARNITTGQAAYEAQVSGKPGDVVEFTIIPLVYDDGSGDKSSSLQVTQPDPTITSSGFSVGMVETLTGSGIVSVTSSAPAKLLYLPGSTRILGTPTGTLQYPLQGTDPDSLYQQLLKTIVLHGATESVTFQMKLQ